jgi:hypothetical protein
MNRHDASWLAQLRITATAEELPLVAGGEPEDELPSSIRNPQSA